MSEHVSKWMEKTPEERFIRYYTLAAKLGYGTAHGWEHTDEYKTIADEMHDIFWAMDDGEQYETRRKIRKPLIDGERKK